jgi:hypothetical protein
MKRGGRDGEMQGRGRDGGGGNGGGNTGRGQTGREGTGRKGGGEARGGATAGRGGHSLLFVGSVGPRLPFTHTGTGPPLTFVVGGARALVAVRWWAVCIIDGRHRHWKVGGGCLQVGGMFFVGGSCFVLVAGGNL